jgi:hypothetical protein
MRRFAPSSVDVAAHQRYEFHLEGAHRAAPCQACHAELRAALAASTLRNTRGRPLTFREPKARCADCHATPHGAQFDRNRKSGACEACHDLEGFKPASRFDHNRDAAFRLDGAHAPVACALCHRSEAGPKGPRVIWKPVASRCESCHTREEATAATTLQKPAETPARTEAKREEAAAARRTGDALPRPANQPGATAPAAGAADATNPAPVGSRREAAPSPAPPGDQKDVSASQVCGEVRDAARGPIVGAQVSIADLGRTAATDERGHFCISAPAGGHEVSVQAIGFEPKRRTVKVAGTVEVAIVLKAARAIANFALNSNLFRTGAGAQTEWPVEARTVVERARRCSERAAAHHSAFQFDLAADEWERVLARAGDGLPALEARYRAAESRYLAWRFDPTRQRARMGLDALTSFLGRAPQGAARDSAAGWADRLKP